MRSGTPLHLLLTATLLAGCAKPATDNSPSVTETTTTAAATDTSATTTTTDNRSTAEKAVGAGLQARDKAEELKREADAKAKEADATNQ